MSKVNGQGHQGVVDIPDAITCANFGEDRLKGLGMAGGQNLPFSIDFDRRPYNTLALPCVCVMTILIRPALLLSDYLSKTNSDHWA